VFVPFAGGRPSGKAYDFVTGFLDGSKAQGRPAGIALDNSGVLLIADDGGKDPRIIPATRRHERRSTTAFSSTPMPAISTRIAAKSESLSETGVARYSRFWPNKLGDV
jgi:hypothetical protein